MTETIASRTGVEIFHGQLSKTGDISQIGTLLLDVIVTARGVSDLIYTSKAFEPATFFEEVAEFLKERQIPVESKVKLTGISGRSYTVHFKVLIQPVRYVQVLSPITVAGLKPKVDAAVRMWVDCNHELNAQRKVTVLNDVDFQWKSPDVSILTRLSTVQFWTHKEDLAKVLQPSGQK